MPADKQIIGLFDSETDAAGAVRELKDTPWRLDRVHSPIPSHRISDAIGVKKSRVGWFTLAGGIIGFFTGFSFAAFTATRWSLIVSGKPVVALVPFFIVGFEFTILFAIFGNVLGLISQARLPDYGDMEQYDPRCSGDHFGIVASCAENDQNGLLDFFETRGAEVRVFD
jgi:Alternative complex III, ActD subunit